MGSPLSPIIADLVLQDLKEEALNRLPCILPIYFRYVDDILLAAPRGEIDNILGTFNSLHDRLKFTLELSENNCINFLNVKIRSTEHGCIFDLFYKPTCSHRFLNYHSQHPIIHKKGVILNLVDKILRLSDPVFYQKNFEHLIEVLLNNNYPLELIFTTINQKIKSWIHTDADPSKINNNYEDFSAFFVIPYVSGVSEKFFPILKKHNLKLVYSCQNKLDKIVRTGKDILEPMSNCDVIYRISCNDCDASYVGQTKRQLGTRIKEHRSDINKKSGSPSVISLHRMDLDHEFDWDGVKILDRERSYGKRLISEMIHIKRQSNSLNRQLDTELFPDSYLPILKLFK